MGWNYFSMLGLKLNHVSKRGYRLFSMKRHNATVICAVDDTNIIVKHKSIKPLTDRKLWCITLYYVVMVTLFISTSFKDDTRFTNLIFANRNTFSLSSGHSLSIQTQISDKFFSERGSRWYAIGTHSWPQLSANHLDLMTTKVPL